MPKNIHIEKREMWNEITETFDYIDECDIVIEHSLYAIEKWEEKYHKPFMVEGNKTGEELMDYIRMMTLNEVDDSAYSHLSEENIKEINEYMNNPMTATVFSKEDEETFNKKSDGFVTAELVYYWMTAENIPFECRFWNINKLITLIKVCSIKNKPDDKKNKKLTSKDLQTRKAVMDARRKMYNTNG